MSTNSSTLSGNAAKNSSTRTALSSATLRSDLQTLKSDLDTLLAHAADLTDTELNEAHERILAKFSSLRHAARGIAVQAGRQFNHGVEVTSEYVKEKPVKSIALAVGLGALIGLIVGRR